MASVSESKMQPAKKIDAQEIAEPFRQQVDTVAVPQIDITTCHL